MLNAEELDHFLAIVESMAGEGKTIGNAIDRMKDEGLSELEAQTVIRTYWALHGKDPFPDPVVPQKPHGGN
jgi:hypothetical protein